MSDNNQSGELDKSFSKNLMKTIFCHTYVKIDIIMIAEQS